MKAVLRVVVVAASFSATSGVAEERPVKDLREIERFALGTWRSQITLPFDFAGVGSAGAVVGTIDEGKYNANKKLLQSRLRYVVGEQEVEGTVFVARVNPDTGIVEFWHFDLLDGMVLEGAIYRDGDNYFLRGRGVVATPGTKETLNFQTEWKFTVVDEDTLKWQVTSTTLNGVELPFPGTRIEHTSKRVKE